MDCPSEVDPEPAKPSTAVNGCGAAWLFIEGRDQNPRESLEARGLQNDERNKVAMGNHGAGRRHLAVLCLAFGELKAFLDHPSLPGDRGCRAAVNR
jgi:hypothetical protein